MLIFCSLLIAFGATAQSKLGSQTSKIAKDSTLIKIHDLLEDVDFRIHGLDRYKLYPTENIYNFLQLDTSTGKIDVAQWSLDDGKEGSVTLLTMKICLLKQGVEHLNYIQQRICINFSF